MTVFDNKHGQCVFLFFFFIYRILCVWNILPIFELFDAQWLSLVYLKRSYAEELKARFVLNFGDFRSIDFPRAVILRSEKKVFYFARCFNKTRVKSKEGNISIIIRRLRHFMFFFVEVIHTNICGAIKFPCQ